MIRSLETGEDRELSLADVRLPSRYGAAELSWSPDGDVILFRGYAQRNRQGVYQISPETGELTLVVPPRAGFRIQGPLSSADGRRVFYALNPDTPAGGGRISVRDLATGTETELYREEEDANAIVGPELAMSPDGRHLAFGAAWFPGTGAAVLKVIPAAGGEPRELLRFASPGGPVDRNGMNFRPSFLAWTPDGRHLLFIKGDDEKTELWRVAVDSGEAAKLVETEGWGTPQLHPDGRQMAFTTVLEANEELWVIENFLPSATSTGQ